VQAALELVEPEAEIAPGIRAIALFGHTPGQLGLEISSAGERLLFAADAIIHPLNLRYPEAIARVDYNPEEMVATRMRFLEKAARDKSLVATSHFPFPGVGYVIPEGNRWEWKPIWESEARPQHAGV
jgi:glyoxylase-like metal-dependent hydrolase (beta-lactamase superfamily II)